MEEDLTSCIVYSLLSLFLVVFAGAMSGLTVGLLSLGELELEMKLISGTSEEQAQAKKILPIISDHHLILVTLLLANAAAMEALPVFLDEIVSAYAAVILSTTFVLIFGEVLPQALLTGPGQLKLASKLIPLVRAVQVLMFPLAYPIAKALDKVLGKKKLIRYSNDDLKSLVSLHVSNFEFSQGISQDQANIIHKVIDLKDTCAKQCMREVSEVLCVSEDTILDQEILQKFVSSKHSWFPVYRGKPRNVIGILKVKSLVNLNFHLKLTIKYSGIELAKPFSVTHTDSLLNIFNLFSYGKGHIALVKDSINKDLTIGIITLKDVVEYVCKRRVIDKEDFGEIPYCIKNDRSGQDYYFRRSFIADSYYRMP